MHSWGITNNILIGNVFAAHGDLRAPSITTNQRITIAKSAPALAWAQIVK
jgi:hypothetical protein